MILVLWFARRTGLRDDHIATAVAPDSATVVISLQIRTDPQNEISRG